MHMHTDKPRQNSNQGVVNNPVQRHSAATPAVQATKQRMPVIAHEKLHQVVNDSPRLRQLKAHQEMANNSLGQARARTVQLAAMPMANNYATETPGVNPITGSAQRPGTMQLQRKNRKLSDKAEANRQRLLAKRHKKDAGMQKHRAAEQEFFTMLGNDGALDQHKFPFDGFTKEEPIDQALDRLPMGMRNSSTLRSITTLPDSAHGQHSARTKVNKGEFQEALAGWHFAHVRGLSNVKSMGAQIDFAGTDRQGREVPFDPFMSPLSGEGKQATEGDKKKWALADSKGSYYKHTHSKGGDLNTVGVWDQTYSSSAQVSDLKGRLKASRADQNTNVHELRVPIASAVATEHIAAERQIDKSNADKNRWKEVKKRYDKTQRRKPTAHGITFEEALVDDSQMGRYWSTQV